MRRERKKNGMERKYKIKRKREKKRERNIRRVKEEKEWKGNTK